MLPIIPVWFYIVLHCAMFILALVTEDRDARIGTLYVCASFAVMTPTLLPLRHTHPQLPWPTIDLAASAVDFVALFTLAIVSRCGWTLAIGSIALVSLATDTIAVFFPWPTWVKGTADVIWYFLLCAVLVFGCLRSKPRTRLWSNASGGRATDLT